MTTLTLLSLRMQRFVVKYIALLIIIFVVGVAALVYRTTVTNNNLLENSAYIRVSNCILSKNAVERTQEDIEYCYNEAEQTLGVELDYFDTRGRR